MKDPPRKEYNPDSPSAVFVILSIFLSLIVALIVLVATSLAQYPPWLALIPVAAGITIVVTSFMEPGRARKIGWGALCALLLTGLLTWGSVFCLRMYDRSITIGDSAPFSTDDYLPFQTRSKIARLDAPSALRLSGPLPVVDGATALFPVYSAFVNAVYPEDIPALNEPDSPFQYNNTIGAYDQLTDSVADVVFGAYPSEEQIAHAEKWGKPFQYTPIGREGFVFFVNRNNPVDGLSSEEIRKIYAGEITNWKEVGGMDQPIEAFQRNEGSGSQSALVRFMEDVPLMQPPTRQVQGLMSGIIDQTADYRNHANSMGFSFRYYAQQLLANKGIKLLSVDGAAPTLENIRNGSYPLTSQFYAVTNRNSENTEALLEWILSPQGQELIEKTGYAAITGDSNS